MMDDNELGFVGDTDSGNEKESAFAHVGADKINTEELSEKLNESLVGSARGGIVTARGTGDGLVLRLDGRVDGSSLKEAIIDFLNSRKGFMSGNEVSLEWVSVLPPKALVSELSTLLSVEFSINVKSSVLWEPPKRSVPGGDDFSSGTVKSINPLEKTRLDKAVEKRVVKGPVKSKSGDSSAESKRGEGISASTKSLRPASASSTSRAPSLFDGIEAFGGAMAESADDEEIFADESTHNSSRTQGDRSPGFEGFNPAIWDDPDARIIYSTIRSGQKIETEHSMVIFGDVNSGAELVAGGDIIVLGTLRGVAHAGAYDETGGGRVILALNLQATQLRIGMTISRGSTEMGNVTEVARVEGNLIVVEPYSSRTNWGRRR